MQRTEPSTLPPGPADKAAEEHARRLAEVDASLSQTRRAGLIRDLAEAYFSGVAHK